MLLAIDIGNTNTIVGVYEGEKQICFSRIRTDASKMPDEYAVIMDSILRLHHTKREDIDGAIISSVVPPLIPVFRSAVSTLCGVRALCVGPGLKTGLNIKLDNPAQLGGDLACVSVAALEKYPLPSIVFDLGTATTVTALDREGNFLGGSILPGVKISLETLSSKTAQLPQIDLSATPKSIVGTNTVDCMLSGILFGNASMMDGMILRYREVLGEDLTVIATGGLAPAIVPHCKNEIFLDENLLMDGLRLIYNKNKK